MEMILCHLHRGPLSLAFFLGEARQQKINKNTLINEETRTHLYFTENPMDTQWTGAGQPLDQGLGCQREPHLTFDLNDRKDAGRSGFTLYVQSTFHVLFYFILPVDLQNLHHLCLTDEKTEVQRD